MPATATNHDALRVYYELEPGINPEVRSMNSAGTIPGVYIIAAAGTNGVGTGELRWTADGTGLQWRAPGELHFGQPVYPSGIDDYLLEAAGDRSKWVRVHVEPSWAQPLAAHRVMLGDVYDNGLQATDVPANQAQSGDVLIETLSIKNESPVTVQRVVAWRHPAATTLDLSTDQIFWEAPTSEYDGLLLGDLAPDGAVDLFVRRTIAAASPADPKVLNLIGLAWDVV